MKKQDNNINPVLLPRNGLAHTISQKFSEIGHPLTPLEATLFSHVGYLSGRPGRGTFKNSIYMLIKEENAFVATISSNGVLYQVLAVQCLALSALPTANMMVPAKTTPHWSHHVARAFGELGGGSFCHIQAPTMPQVPTDGGTCHASLVHDVIYFVYGKKAYKLVPTTE